MPTLTPEDERAADRLAFALLRDAYCDLAAVLRNLNDGSAATMFDLIEGRLVDALSRLHAGKAEGANSDAVVVAAGARLSAVMDGARGSAGRKGDPVVDQDRSANLLPRATLRQVK